MCTLFEEVAKVLIYEYFDSYLFFFIFITLLLGFIS